MRLYTYRIPDPGDVVTSPGTRTETLFTPKFNGSEIILVKSGTVDVQDRIESFAPYCDLRYMLTQLRLGDRSVLSPKQPLYGDFSGMPSHPVDAINFISDIQSTFDRMPEEIKSACNNDWRVYFTQLVTGQSGGSPGVSDHVQDSNPAHSTSSGKDVNDNDEER